VSSRSSETVLAIDIGTTALKAATFDRAGSLLAETSREYELMTPQPDWVEMSCDTYWSTLKAVLAELWGSPAVDRRSVVATGISAQGETLVPVDGNGRPLRHAIVWLDNRAQSEAIELDLHLGVERIYEVTGQPEMLAAWPAAKLRWLNANEPQTVSATHKYLLIEDYLLWRLTGEYVTEGSLATSTCYWDFRNKRWWPEMLELIEVDEAQLPTLVEPGSRVGPILADVAAELGLPVGTAVCAGALDQACGAIGAGNVASGGFSENTGAAIALCATIDGPRLDPQGRIPCHYHGIPDTWMFHTFTGGGIVLRWFRDAFCPDILEQARATGADAYDLLSQLAAGVPPGADGLLVLPHLQGAMAPENNDDARGVFFGLTLRHGRAHVVRAIMESIAFVVRRNVESMRELGVEIDGVRALGGGSRSGVWKQIEADVLGVRVTTMQQSDAGTLGAALLAGVAMGWWADVGEAAGSAVRESFTFEPDPANRALYDDAYGSYIETYEALEPVFEAG
jgi:sugar (pentulose or hexulose) kinase